VLTLKAIDRKMLLNEARKQDLIEKIHKLEEAPLKRELSDLGFAASLLIPFVGTTSLAVSIATQNNFSMTEFLMSCLASTTAGLGAGFVNSYCYREKPLTNRINDFRIKSCKRKYNKLTKENESYQASRDIYATYGVSKEDRLRVLPIRISYGLDDDFQVTSQEDEDRLNDRF